MHAMDSELCTSKSSDKTTTKAGERGDISLHINNDARENVFRRRSQSCICRCGSAPLGCRRAKPFNEEPSPVAGKIVNNIDFKNIRENIKRELTKSVNNSLNYHRDEYNKRPVRGQRTETRFTYGTGRPTDQTNLNRRIVGRPPMRTIFNHFPNIFNCLMRVLFWPFDMLCRCFASLRDFTMHTQEMLVAAAGMLLLFALGCFFTIVVMCVGLYIFSIFSRPPTLHKFPVYMDHQPHFSRLLGTGPEYYNTFLGMEDKPTGAHASSHLNNNICKINPHIPECVNYKKLGMKNSLGIGGKSDIDINSDFSASSDIKKDHACSTNCETENSDSFLLHGDNLKIGLREKNVESDFIFKKSCFSFATIDFNGRPWQVLPADTHVYGLPHPFKFPWENQPAPIKKEDSFLPPPEDFDYESGDRLSGGVGNGFDIDIQLEILGIMSSNIFPKTSTPRMVTLLLYGKQYNLVAKSVRPMVMYNFYPEKLWEFINQIISIIFPPATVVNISVFEGVPKSMAATLSFAKLIISPPLITAGANLVIVPKPSKARQLLIDNPKAAYIVLFIFYVIIAVLIFACSCCCCVSTLLNIWAGSRNDMETYVSPHSYLSTNPQGTSGQRYAQTSSNEYNYGTRLLQSIVYSTNHTENADINRQYNSNLNSTLTNRSSDITTKDNVSERYKSKHLEEGECIHGGESERRRHSSADSRSVTSAQETNKNKNSKTGQQVSILRYRSRASEYA